MGTPPEESWRTRERGQAPCAYKTTHGTATSFPTRRQSTRRQSTRRQSTRRQAAPSIAEGEWAGHLLERFALGRDTPAPGNGSGGQHRRRPEQIAPVQAGAIAGVDEHAEQPGAADTADAGSDGIEERNGE